MSDKEQKRRDKASAEVEKDLVGVGRETVGYRIAKFVDELTAKYDLTTAQRVFLALRWRFKTDQECAKALGLRRNTVYNWKRPQVYNDGRRTPAFLEAYEEFFKGFDGIILGEMEGLMGKAVQRVEDLLDAKKQWFGKGGEMMEAPDYDAIFKGIQALFHYTGRWGQKQSTEVNNQYISISDEFAKLLKKKQEAFQSIDGEVKLLGGGDEGPEDG